MKSIQVAICTYFHRNKFILMQFTVIICPKKCFLMNLIEACFEEPMSRKRRAH